MAGSHVFRSQNQDEPLLFWVVVQACRDIVNYGRPGSPDVYVFREDFLHAYEWVMDDKPQLAAIGYDDDGELVWAEITFTEALLELGVHPDNVEHIRHAIARGPGKLAEEKKQLARECYAKLEGQSNEPEPFWRTVHNAIMNHDTTWAEEERDVQDELGRY